MSLLAATELYVEALQEGEADWRDYYQISSVLLKKPESDTEPDAE
jgi:hypothetical protein